MNNGKVRIYELSRELNLDNKDILAVCERLNISVKSHSSTITESEAERIRKTAEKYIDRNLSSGKTSASDRGSFLGKDGSHAANEPKKQEILEIRRPQVHPGSNGKHSGNDTNTTLMPPPIATPPKSPVTQQNQPPAKPMLNRPVLSKPNNPSSASSESITDRVSDQQTELKTQPQVPELPVQPSPLDTDIAEASNPPATAAVASPAPVSRVRTPKSGGNAPKAAKPTPPPTKPLASPPSRPQTSSSAPNKPVLKGAKSDATTSEQPVKEFSKQKPNRPPKDQPRAIDPDNKPSRRDGSGGGKSLDAPRSSAPPGVRKQRPVGALVPPKSISSTDVDSELEEEGDDLEVEAPEISLLQRPTLPRPTKKGPVWEEDDEEGGDFPNKAKAGTKVKARRVKPTVDEDDEDLEEVLDIAAPMVVSLSLARPAKPKAAMSRPSSPQTVSIQAKAKKPTQPGQSSSQSNQRTRRSNTETQQERPTRLLLSGSMTVQELADVLMVSETEIIKRLFGKGIAVNITQTLDPSIITMVAAELEVEVVTQEKEAEARKVIEMLDEADMQKLQRRPPVVTIMGHVDHGKTTLLDSIRKTKVAQGEAGGITQHIGAYHVDVEHEGKIQQVVFLDTPGHEAFTAMRARGARVTDVAILVVAADDGVQPQTIEAISHAKAAQVPIVIAINKIDKEGAQPDRVKQELTEYGLVAEEWGGDTIMVPVSAMKGENLDTLLEMICLVAEVEDLYANPDRAAKGTVIEAHLDKARGPVATLLVQNGTLRVGDIVVAGSALGKVRAMIDDHGDRVDDATPSFAVEVLGLREVPKAGDEFDVFSNEKEASAIADNRAQQARAARLLQGRISLSGFSQQAKEGELKELNLILKGDVQGSVEAIVGALRQLPQKEVQLRLLLAAPGEVTETDIDLAAASNAVILGFNTTFASGARQAADQLGVDVREYNIIYKLLDDVQGAMEGLLEPELVEEPLGQVEVRAIFPVGKSSVAGCYILSGKAIRNCKVRIRRGNQVVYEGVLDSLKRMKDDVKEVNAGYECGIMLDNFSDWREGDIIEAYRMVTKRRTLSS
jgi:translation initiation factor IF-2